jgi:hypothetical protein
VGKHPDSSARGASVSGTGLPHPLERRNPVRVLGRKDRVTIQAGNAFEAVPPGADAYILSHVIHDWNEDHCLTILRNCRAAMTPTSRLLIIELVLRECARHAIVITHSTAS